MAAASPGGAAVAEHIEDVSEKSLLIINPNSGTRQKDSLPELLSEGLSARGIELEVAVTEKPGDAGSLATEAIGDGYSCIIVAGGDGTVNDVASAMCGTGVPMGILPCGSGNGLARSLAIPQDPRKAVDVITAGHTIDIDCGEANSRRFFCTFGMGFDAAVTEKFSQEKKRGKMSYVKSALIEFLNFTPNVYGISINGKIITERAMVVAVCNASQYGNNAYIAPSASLSDGMLDITVIHDGPLIQQALAGIQLMSGRIDKNILCNTFRADRLEISRLDDGPAHIDGELFNPGRLVSIGCRPKCLRVIASLDIEKPFRPISDPLRLFLQDLGSDIRQAFG